LCWVLGLLFQQLIAFFFQHRVQFVGQIGQHVTDVVQHIATSCDIDGAVHPPTEGRRASTVRRMRRRIGKSSQRRMRPRTALFDRSSIVIGERHRIRFRTRCRFETGVGSVAPLAELHGGASGLGVGGVVARTALSFSAGEHFHT